MNPVKNLAVSVLFTVTLGATHALAQADHGGHGGGGWDCGKKVEMFDYFDGVNKRGLKYNLMSEANTTEKNVQIVLDNIKTRDIYNAFDIEALAKDFLADLTILEKDPTSLQTKVAKMNQDPIKILNDTGLNYEADGCKPIQIVWQQNPTFKEDRLFDVHYPTYVRMKSTVQRATMVLHEAIYHLLLATQKDSSTTRAYLSWVASTDLKNIGYYNYIKRAEDSGFQKFGYRWSNGMVLVAPMSDVGVFNVDDDDNNPDSLNQRIRFALIDRDSYKEFDLYDNDEDYKNNRDNPDHGSWLIGSMITSGLQFKIETGESAPSIFSCSGQSLEGSTYISLKNFGANSLFLNGVLTPALFASEDEIFAALKAKAVTESPFVLVVKKNAKWSVVRLNDGHMGLAVEGAVRKYVYQVNGKLSVLRFDTLVEGQIKLSGVDVLVDRR